MLLVIFTTLKGLYWGLSNTETFFGSTRSKRRAIRFYTNNYMYSHDASVTDRAEEISWMVSRGKRGISLFPRASSSRLTHFATPRALYSITQAPQCCVGYSYKNQYRELYSCQDVIYLENVFFLYIFQRIYLKKKRTFHYTRFLLLMKEIKGRLVPKKDTGCFVIFASISWNTTEPYVCGFWLELCCGFQSYFNVWQFKIVQVQ